MVTPGTAELHMCRRSQFLLGFSGKLYAKATLWPGASNSCSCLLGTESTASRRSSPYKGCGFSVSPVHALLRHKHPCVHLLCTPTLQDETSQSQGGLKILSQSPFSITNECHSRQEAVLLQRRKDFQTLVRLGSLSQPWCPGWAGSGAPRLLWQQGAHGTVWPGTTRWNTWYALLCGCTTACSQLPHTCKG